MAFSVAVSEQSCALEAILAKARCFVILLCLLLIFDPFAVPHLLALKITKDEITDVPHFVEFEIGFAIVLFQLFLEGELAASLIAKKKRRIAS